MLPYQQVYYKLTNEQLGPKTISNDTFFYFLFMVTVGETELDRIKLIPG